MPQIPQIAAPWPLLARGAFGPGVSGVQRAMHGLGGGDLLAYDEVAVDVFGDADAGVSEDLADHFNGHAFGEQDGGTRMM